MAWVNVSEAAAAADVSERTVRRWIAEDRVQSRKANGRVFVDLTSDRTTPSRHFTDTAKAMAVTSATNLDAVQSALAAVTENGKYVRRELKTARWTSRTAISVCVMTAIAAVIGYYELAGRHHDTLSTTEATHRTEITDLATDYADVILSLERTVNHATGQAEARADELVRAEDRHRDVVVELNRRAADQLQTTVAGHAAEVERIEAAGRGETVAGTPVLLMASEGE